MFVTVNIFTASLDVFIVPAKAKIKLLKLYFTAKKKKKIMKITSFQTNNNKLQQLRSNTKTTLL